MLSTALRAERIVKTAAQPTYVGEKIKEQRRRSFDRLRMGELPNGDSIHLNAWYRRAAAPTLVTLEEQAEKTGLVVPPSPAEIIADIQKQVERLRAIDAEFHAPQIDFYCAEIERLARMLGPNG